MGIKLHQHCIRKGICFVICLLLLQYGLLGQSVASASIKHPYDTSTNYNEIQPLKIGDKVPDITFHNVLNYESKTAKLSDFRGKLVILDMWSIICSSCIAGFSKMEKLQKQFANKIQILLVNPHEARYDSEEKIISTLNKLKARTGFYPSLPIPIHDSILNYYFPHQSVPHKIWIDGEGAVIAITGSGEVTKENIAAFLSNKAFRVPVKDDWAFDKAKPLFVNGNGGSYDNHLFRSLFTKYKEGIGKNYDGVRRNEKNEVVGMYIVNTPLAFIIRGAFRNVFFKMPNNRIIFDVTNPDQFKWEFNLDYAYCYDLTIPPISWENYLSKKHLQDDLFRYFNITVSKEYRKLKCIVITASEQVMKSFSKFKQKELDLENQSIKKYIHRYSTGEIINLLESKFDTPLIDETRIKNNIDIEFPDHFDLSDSNAILQVLKNAGLNIKEEEREIEVIVITDKR